MTSTHPFRSVATTTLTVVGVVAALYVLWLLRRPLSWIVLATFIAIVLAGPVTHLSRHMKRGWAIALTYIGLLLIPVAIVAIVVPPIVREGANLVDALPQYAADFEEWVQSNERLRSLDEDFNVTGRLEELAAELPGRLGGAASWLGGLGLGVINSTFAAVTILLLSVCSSSRTAGGGSTWCSRCSPPSARRPCARRSTRWGRRSAATWPGSFCRPRSPGC